MITIIGSLNYDLVSYTDKVPGAGETFQANSFENHLGGKGLNEALACARLGTSKVRMIGKVGSDSFGKELVQALVDSNVDTTHVETLENISTGVAVIMVETSGENRILITAGANGQLKPAAEEYEEFFADSTEGDFVVLQNEYPHTIESIEWIKTNKPAINIAYNPSPFYGELITPSILNKVDLLIVNEGEALDVANSLLSDAEMEQFRTTISTDKVKGFGGLAQKLQTTVDQKNTSAVIITMGSLGSVYTCKGQSPQFEESKKVYKVIDTTGAGDTFFGGVVLQLTLGVKLAQAVSFATMASSLAIQKKGAAESIPTLQEMQNVHRV